MNRVGEGNRQKKRRTEDLDLSAVASETTAFGHKGGSDSEISGGLTDEEFDRSGVMKIHTPRKYGHPGVPIFT